MKFQSQDLLALLALFGCNVGSRAQVIAIDLQVRLEQDEGSGEEGYVASYRHRGVQTTSDLIRESSVLDATWSGYETCYEPPLRVEWKSGIDFESFGFDEPDVHVVIRGADVWFLYDPALEYGVEHPGMPACDSGGAVAPGTTVEKRFFSGDLEDVTPSGDLPVHLRDEELSVGGFVLTVVPLDRLKLAEKIPIAVERLLEDGDFRISLRVDGTVRLRE